MINNRKRNSEKAFPPICIKVFVEMRVFLIYIIQKEEKNGARYNTFKLYNKNNRFFAAIKFAIVKFIYARVRVIHM